MPDNAGIFTIKVESDDPSASNAGPANGPPVPPPPSIANRPPDFPNDPRGFAGWAHPASDPYVDMLRRNNAWRKEQMPKPEPALPSGPTEPPTGLKAGGDKPIPVTIASPVPLPVTIKDWPGRPSTTAPDPSRTPPAPSQDLLKQLGGLPGIGNFGQFASLINQLRASPAATAGASAGAGGAGAATGGGGTGGAAAGAGAGAAAGGALATVGPIIAGILLADLAARAFANNLNDMSRQVQTAGHQVAQFAANDHLGAMITGAENVAATFDKIPIVGQVFAAEMRLATGTVKAFREVNEAFVRRALELARFSAPISFAAAEARVRGIRSDIREANAIGPDAARLVEANSQANAEVREILLPIKQFVTRELADFMQEVVLILRVVKVATELIGNNETTIKLLTGIAKGMTGLAALEAINQFLQDRFGEKPEDLSKSQLDQLINQRFDSEGPEFKPGFRDPRSDAFRKARQNQPGGPP